MLYQIVTVYLNFDIVIMKKLETFNRKLYGIDVNYLVMTESTPDQQDNSIDVNVLLTSGSVKRSAKKPEFITGTKSIDNVQLLGRFYLQRKVKVISNTATFH